MKLKNLFCVIVAMFATMSSYGATAADYSDIVYAKDVKASLGGIVEVPIYLKNLDYAVKSLQFSMELPDGVSFVEVENVGHKYTANDLTKNWTISFRAKDGEAANTGLAMMSYQNDRTTTVASGDQEVFTITLQVDANTTAGSKVIVMKEITLTDGNGTEQTILSGSESITSYVNIQRAKVVANADGYSVSIVPSKMTPGLYADGHVTTLDIYYTAAADIANMSFNINFPDVKFYSTAIKEDGETQVNPVLNTDVYNNSSKTLSISANDDQNLTATYAGVKSTRLASKRYIKAASTPTKLATITIESEEDLASGNYTITIGDISMEEYVTSGTGTIHTGINYSSLLVNDQTDKNPIVYGYITDVSAVTPAIPESLTSIDITATTVSNDVVDAIVENIATKNANAIIYAPSTYTGEKANVIVPNDNGVLICKNLTVEDGVAFSIPASFTATTASYSRTMSNAWGTICLPYAVTSDASAAYYKINGIVEGVLSIEKYETLPAGTPALVKKLSGSEIAPQSANVAVNGALNNVSGTVTMIGSYTNDTKIEDYENAYFIRNNKFYSSSVPFYVDAFRAYFTVASGAKASVLTIGDEEATAINALVGESEVKVEAVYDANGARRSDIQNGLNIVKLSNGKVQKIMVK